MTTPDWCPEQEEAWRQRWAEVADRVREAEAAEPDLAPWLHPARPTPPDLVHVDVAPTSAPPTTPTPTAPRENAKTDIFAPVGPRSTWRPRVARDAHLPAGVGEQDPTDPTVVAAFKRGVDPFAPKPTPTRAERVTADRGSLVDMVAKAAPHRRADVLHIAATIVCAELRAGTLTAVDGTKALEAFHRAAVRAGLDDADVAAIIANAGRRSP